MLDKAARDEVQAMINEVAKQFITAVNQNTRTLHEFVGVTALLQQEFTPLRGDLLEFEHRNRQEFIDVRTELRSVRDEVRGLKVELELVGDRTDRMHQRLGALEADVAELKSDVAELKSDVTELKANVREILDRL